ncbi:uncharacterized protein LOC124292374 [Haliotis rubra]|uniref:uncharacterized protein LOC124292374 n=1 Tax=Haliotis rubra TaxID=36100 RepID=UPI001EE542AE|nr:uncharacterized protein LOC124292374 [Haliotis rubra]
MTHDRIAMNLNDQVCLWILTTISVVSVGAQDGSSVAMDDISKAFVSAAVLVAVGVIAYVVAKLVDYCYDRATLNDDASDISEHTRKLIRARIALSHFKKPKAKKKKKKKPMTLKQQKKNTTKFLKLWSTNAKRRGSQRLTDNVINVEEANANDKLTVNGTVKKSLAHVTFEDEVGPQTEGGINVPVIAITEPEGHNTSQSTKESGRTTPIAAKVNPGSGRTTPIKDVSGRSSPQKESPVKASGRTTPVKDVSGRSSPQKESPVKVSGRTTPVKDVSGKTPQSRILP